MNLIFNFHFTGSPLWDLFSKEAVMIENSWNTAVRVMFDLPIQTHRSFIEPVSETKHLKFCPDCEILGIFGTDRQVNKESAKAAPIFHQA